MENSKSQDLDVVHDTTIDHSENQFDQKKVDRYLEKLKTEQNLPMALVAGLISCFVAAGIWAAVTVSTNYQIGYMAIAVGFIVGFSVKFMGKGLDQIYGVIGAVFALMGCVLGNIFSVIGFVADTQGLGYFETLSTFDFSLIPDILKETFNGMDLLFYGFAIYAGYKYSFRAVTEEELQKEGIVS